MSDELLMDAFDRVGWEVRSVHRYGFRCGEWAKILLYTETRVQGQAMWLVEFRDGVTDWWRCEDPDGRYEFRKPRVLPT